MDRVKERKTPFAKEGRLEYNESMAVEYPKIVLKEGEENRILKGEFWAYDNEIRTPLATLASGELVRLCSADGRYIATGYVNPASVITFRLLSRDPEERIDRDFLARRIEQADGQRLKIDPPNRYYRMVYGEADFLPGLVIDRFDDHFIVQITTAGMERFKEEIFAAIASLYPRAVIIEKSLTTAREKEKLETINRVVTPGRASAAVIEINGVRFKIDFLKSQKTGFFLDQRENYRLLESISRGATVLDAFAYAGAWGLHAYHYGARRVDFLEISTEFLDQARENVLLNGFPPGDFEYIREDAVRVLKEMSKEGVRKDIVILDPPAFVKARNKLKEALRGYKEINLRALKMVNPGGFLVTCSCSHFLPRDEFIRVIQDAALDAGRRIKLIAFRFQPYDHSVLLPLYQSDYLKCALFYVY